MTTASKPPGMLTFLAHRWPTALALVLSVSSFFEQVTDQTVRSLAQAMLLLPLIYVVIAALRRRGWTWPFLVVALVGYVPLRMQHTVDPAVVLLAVSLAAAIWGTAHGQHRERDFQVQLAGMVAFGALAIGGLVVDPDLARYLVAAGWIGHGVWDWWHLLKDRVVARTFAEWCSVVDLVIGLSLIVVPLL